MKFANWWHWLTTGLTTSRYTRTLEFENRELCEQLKITQAENHALIFALGKRRTVAYEEPVEQADGESRAPENERRVVPPQRRRRPGKFVGFSQVKRNLESQQTS